MTKTMACPSHPQKLASAPSVSAWVSASAGTGKTKVLTDRLLNLMLAGYDPGKILCLTFTKAAAAEMQTRLFHRLSAWVKMDDNQLHDSLVELWTGGITLDLMTKARSLFTDLLDLPGGIKIQTIHGFCQSVLGRFPIEAKIPAQFSIIDEVQAGQILRRCTALALKSQPIEGGDLLNLLSTHYKDQSFTDTINEILNTREGLRQIAPITVDQYHHCLQDLFDLQNINLLHQDAEINFLIHHCQDNQFDHAGLKSCLEENPNPLLQDWLAASPENRARMIDAYSSLFLTQKKEISKRPKVNHPIEAERIWRILDGRCKIVVAQKSLILFILGKTIYESYQSHKLASGILDYDDLIEKTIDLLTDPEMAAWVLYKLDGGVDHILIDEAQDTNPAQWRVVQTLTQDFFRPDRSDRTLFVVGDAKQSIYSFQGADPNDFINLRHHFAIQSQATGQTWRDVDLTVSFRSTPEVLSLVDKIFLSETLRHQVLSTEKLVHTPFRHTHQGKVHLLPQLIKDENHDIPDLPPWTLPTERRQPPSLERDFAKKLAHHIAYLLSSEVILPSTGKKIEARDILILVRQRSIVIRYLIQHLKALNVAVAGADRLILTDHVAIQDLLSLGQFLLQPLDDLSLATVLTSPLIGFSQDDLMILCLNRVSSLWASLIQQGHTPQFGHAYDWLKAVMDQTDYLTPSELYAFILYHQGGKERILKRLGHEAEDVLSAFMDVLGQLEKTQPPSLELVIGELISQDYELKRDSSDTQANEIRLMTIHGSKGLQAPVVILVEKFGANSHRESTLWSLDPNNPLLLARPSQLLETEVTRKLKQDQKIADDAEDKRLLYVALTRPQDHLYVCGYGNKEDTSSWYGLIEQQGIECLEWQSSSPLFQTDTAEGRLPDFLKEKIKLSITLQPDEPKEKMTDLAHRGIIIHKLLEILPDIPQHDWPTVSLRICAPLTQDLALSEECIQIAQDVLTNPKLSDFFGEKSVAEFELMTGEGNLYRLDRIVLGDVIKILDYKSALIPPDKIPSAIHEQMSTYQKCIAELYPNRPIQCFVLWTATGRLDQLEDIEG